MNEQLMNIKAEKAKPLNFSVISCFLVLMYSYMISIEKISQSMFLLVALLGAAFLMLVSALEYSNTVPDSRTFLCWFATVLFVSLRSADISHGDYGYLLHYVFLLCFFFISCCFTQWIRPAFCVMVFFTAIHVFCTFWFGLSPSFYLNHIVPLFAEQYRPMLIQLCSKGYLAGLTEHYSVNGIYLAIGTGVIFCGAFDPKCKKIIKNMLLILCVVALLMTGKRGPLLFAVLSSFFTYYVYHSEKKRGRLFVALLALCGMAALLFVIALFVPKVSNTINRFMNPGEDITGGRMILYNLAWRLFQSSPFFGIGWGGYKYAANASEIGRIYGSQSFMSAHNVYLQLLCEIGIIGFLFIAGVMFLTFRKTYLLLKNSRNGRTPLKAEQEYFLAISLFVQGFFVLYCLTGNALYDYPSLFPYILMCAVPFAVEGAHRAEKSEEEHEENRSAYIS
jgi:O-antigen ligase